MPFIDQKVINWEGTVVLSTVGKWSADMSLNVPSSMPWRDLYVGAMFLGGLQNCSWTAHISFLRGGNEAASIDFAWKQQGYPARGDMKYPASPVAAVTPPYYVEETMNGVAAEFPTGSVPQIREISVPIVNVEQSLVRNIRMMPTPFYGSFDQVTASFRWYSDQQLVAGPTKAFHAVLGMRSYIEKP